MDDEMITLPRGLVQDAHDALEELPDWSDPSSPNYILYHQLELFLYPDKHKQT